jgi:hypothetical protein
MEISSMLKSLGRHFREERSEGLLRTPAKAGRRLKSKFLLAISIIVLSLQPACGFRKLVLAPARLFQKRAPSKVQYPTSPIRVAYLPTNIPPDDKELRWISLAAPIMMAKISENAQDLDVAPLWEVMPVAVEAAGSSRSITPEGAAEIASRLSAKWATYGELTSVSRGIEMVIDYIPAKETGVPFRYTRIGNVDEIGYGFYDAMEQFTRYLMAHPIDLETVRETRLSSLRVLAEAIDLEYGWFVTADPGKADPVVANLARYDSRLARLIFSPSLYPILGNPPTTTTPQGVKPEAGPPLTNALPSSRPSPSAGQ